MWPGQQNKPKDCSPTGRQFAGETRQPLSCWRYSRSFHFCLRYLNVNTEQHINTNVKRDCVVMLFIGLVMLLDAVLTQSWPHILWLLNLSNNGHILVWTNANYSKSFVGSHHTHELIADLCRPAVSLLKTSSRNPNSSLWNLNECHHVNIIGQHQQHCSCKFGVA